MQPKSTFFYYYTERFEWQNKLLKELDAKLIAEKEDLQTWILSGKLEEYAGTQKVERKPTKAESEEDVSKADRQLHERIAAEVKAQLEAKGKSTEGVETLEEFYGFLKSEALLLQKKYQPQLREGIKIAVDERTTSEGVNVPEDIQVREPRQRPTVLALIAN